MLLIKRIKSFFRQKLYKHDVLVHSTVKIYPKAILSTEYGGSIKIGKNSEILYGVLCMTYGGFIEIGENCSINPYTVLYGHGGLKIGNNVLIAGHCLIIPANHKFENLDIPINKQGESRKGITIEDNVWIGSGCSILDGVTIGSGSIIASGAVVNKNVPKNHIVGGVPAKFIKSRN